MSSRRSIRPPSPAKQRDRGRGRLIARFGRAAAAIDTADAVSLGEEALPLDNESLELAEGRNPKDDSPEFRDES